jgi:hypothetical protein
MFTLDLIKSRRLKKELILKTTNRHLFKLKQIEIVFVDIKSIKPEAVFLFRLVEYIQINAPTSNSPGDAAQCIENFEDIQSKFKPKL